VHHYEIICDLHHDAGVIGSENVGAPQDHDV
jgi:hypothetical protein